MLAFCGGFFVARHQKEQTDDRRVIELEPGFFADPPDALPCSPSLPVYEAVS
jgi:hypothetical protein